MWMLQAWQARMVVDRRLPPGSEAKRAMVSPKMTHLKSSADAYFSWPSEVHVEDLIGLGL